MDLSLSSRSDGDKTVVEVGGEIDVYTAPKLRERIVELVEGGSYNLVIDMERVEFLDSTGLGVLVGANRRASELRSTIRLENVQASPAKVFEITGLRAIFGLD